VLAAHHSYLESLVATALADGIITDTERRDLEAVTRLLAIDPAILHALVREGLLARDRGPVLRPPA
jgi:uncharacterized membrane protein YebE (DUF533 family)